MWPLRTGGRWGAEATEAGPREIPELDRMQPEEVQTATFALG